jgi:hypothetical protein
MSGPAIAMLVVAMLVIWGGLGLAMLNLTKRSPHPPDPTDLQRDL